MEERQHAEQLIFAAEHERLAHLLDVGRDVVVRQHHALGLARAAARENDRGEIVERLLLAAHRALDPCAGQKPEQQRGDSFAEARAGRRFFDQDCFARHLQRDAIEQRLRGDHGFELALRGA